MIIKNLRRFNYESLLSFSAVMGQGLRINKFYLFHFALLVSLKSFYEKFKKKQLKFSFHYVIIGGWPLLSLLWSPSAKLGLIEVLQIILGLYFILFNPNPGKLKDALILGVWINLALSLAEAFALIRYPLSYILNIPAQDVPSGFHWNPNSNALFILIFSPIILSFHKHWIKLFYLLLSSFVIYKANSRIIAIGWIVFLFINLIQEVRKDKKLLALIFIVFICSSFFMIKIHEDNVTRIRKYSLMLPSLKKVSLYLPELFAKRLKGEDVRFDVHAEDSSLHERLLYFDGVAKVIAEHTWFGIGAGGLQTVTHQQSYKKLYLTSPHFYFLEIWAKYGIIYLLEYLVLIGILWVKVFRKNKSVFLGLTFLLVFNPVVSSISYFLPKWVLYRLSLNEIEEQ